MTHIAYLALILRRGTRWKRRRRKEMRRSNQVKKMKNKEKKKVTAMKKVITSPPVNLLDKIKMRMMTR